MLLSVTFSIVVWGERNKKVSALPLIFYLYLTTCCVLVHSLIDFHFNCSAKNELDMEEFMFFLTGGVGLENKVLNLKLHDVPVCRAHVDGSFIPDVIPQRK